jgi:Flp pilus assembly protein TadD
VLNGQKEKALEFNLEAYDFASDDAVICDNLAYSYYLNEDYDKAEEIYTMLLNKKNPPSFPEVYFNFGLVALKKEDKEKAKELFEKALLQKFSYLSDLDKATVEKALAEL